MTFRSREKKRCLDRYRRESFSCVRKIVEFDSLFPKSRNFHSKNEKNLRRIESRWWNRVPAWLTHSILSPLDLEILATLAAVPRMRVLDAR